MRTEQEIIDAWKVGISKEKEDIRKFGYSEDGGINYPDDYEHEGSQGIYIKAHTERT